MKRFWERNYLIVLVFFALTFFFLRPPTDPDLGWHLRYGQTIIEKFEIPRTDDFSYTMPGFEWADSYWLSEAVIYLGYKYFSFLGLSVFFALIADAAFFLALINREDWQKDFFRLRTVPIILTGILLLLPFVGIRPQTISLFFFSLLLYLWREGSKKWLPFLFLIWANFHAGFVLGLLVLWLFWFVDIIAILRRTLLPPKESPFLKKLPWPTIQILTTLATLVNPYGLFLYRSILNDAASSEIKNGIIEWAAPNFHSDLGAFFTLYALGLIALLVLIRTRLKVEMTLMTLVFLLFGFSAVRNIPLLVILATPLWYLLPIQMPWRLPSFYRYWGGFTFFGVALYCLFVFGRSFASGAWSFYDTRGIGDYPQKAMEYLKANPPKGNLFNTYGWGGFVIWNLPEVKTFIDGRMCGWKRSGEPSLFSEYDSAVELKTGWEDILKKYEVDWVLMESEAHLVQALKIRRDWVVTYEDEKATILMRSDNVLE